MYVHRAEWGDTGVLYTRWVYIKVYFIHVVMLFLLLITNLGEVRMSWIGIHFLPYCPCTLYVYRYDSSGVGWGFLVRQTGRNLIYPFISHIHCNDVNANNPMATSN